MGHLRLGIVEPSQSAALAQMSAERGMIVAMHLAALRLDGLNDALVLRELVAMPESDMVERKRSAEPSSLAKVVSGFANTKGGWLLLGVDDDGSLVGWQPAGRAHLRDWLRDVLDNYLDDALPHFEADTFGIDGTKVGVVHVVQSMAAPHFLATGEVFERRNGQTRRASPKRIRELMLRGDGGSIDAARARLDDREIAVDLAIALDAPRKGQAMHARALASVVRISLTEPTDSLAAWVHEPGALQASDAFVASAAQTMNDRGHDWFDPAHLTASKLTAGGHVAAAEWDGRILQQANIAWDLHGLCGVRFAGMRPDDSGVYYLLSDEARDRWLSIALEHLLCSLENIAAFGPAVVRWDLYGIRGADVTTLSNGNVVAEMGTIPAHYNNMVCLDTEIEVGTSETNDTADTLWQQLQRLAGSRPAT